MLKLHCAPTAANVYKFFKNCHLQADSQGAKISKLNLPTHSVKCTRLSDYVVLQISL